MEKEVKNPKFKLTGETKKYVYTTLYRIEALRSFSDVKKGQKGGWVESEENLDHDGDCWIYDNAVVMDKAVVVNNAQVRGEAHIEGEFTRIAQNAYVTDNVWIEGGSQVYGDAHVSGNVKLVTHSVITGNARVSGRVRMFNGSWASGNCQVMDIAHLEKKASIYGDAIIKDQAWISHARIGGDMVVDGETFIGKGTHESMEKWLKNNM